MGGNKDNKVVYSFSRLESFHQCPHGYYLTYVKGHRGGDNVYSYLGGKVHEILEGLQSLEIDKETAMEAFMSAVEEAELFDYNFMNDNVRDKYIANVEHYLENYEPIKAEEFYMERRFEFEIDGIWIKGFIDLYYIDEDGKAVVLDYKTSSKFSAKDLIKKSRQLMLYAYAIECLDGLEIKQVGFDMLKYVNKPWRKRMVLKERCETSEFDGIDYEKGIVLVDYDKDAVEDIKRYIKDTVAEIESLDPEDDRDWMPCMDYNSSFFCRNLCGNYDKCKFQKKM